MYSTVTLPVCIACLHQEWGVGEKSDVYSLGIMMWEMVTGLRPWADFG